MLLFTLFCSQSVLSWFSHFCVEKNLTKNYICGEKMTNISYGNTFKIRITRLIHVLQRGARGVRESWIQSDRKEAEMSCVLQMNQVAIHWRRFLLFFIVINFSPVFFIVFSIVSHNFSPFFFFISFLLVYCLSSLFIVFYCFSLFPIISNCFCFPQLSEF